MRNLTFVDRDDSGLRTPTVEYGGDTVELHDLAEAMIELMRQGNGVDTGIGLAAPQVGYHVRMFVMDWAPLLGTACINPRVLQASRSQVYGVESCLSAPGFRASVKRPKVIYAQWVGLDGAVWKRQIDGMAARCFQHELDHLDGRVIWAPAVAA